MADWVLKSNALSLTRHPERALGYSRSAGKRGQTPCHLTRQTTSSMPLTRQVTSTMPLTRQMPYLLCCCGGLWSLWSLPVGAHGLVTARHRYPFPPPLSPSLISRTVSVDVKHHDYYIHLFQPRKWQSLAINSPVKSKSWNKIMTYVRRESFS